MYSKNLLSDYNNKVFSVSKSKEPSPISPERHTSFNLINRSLKQLLPTDYQYIKSQQRRNQEVNSGVRVTYTPASYSNGKSDCIPCQEIFRIEVPTK